MKKLILTLLFLVLTNQLSAQSHFTPIWSGTPYQAMNIFLESATFAGSQLESGDEVAVFDGDNCVGVKVLTGAVSSYVEIKASADDPITTQVDGFIGGHTIIYKLWKASSSTEVDSVIVTYDSASPDTTFTALGTAFVNLEFIDQSTGLTIETIPTKYFISQNFPNPFNPTTKIRYEIPKESFVSLKVYDMLGREVKSLVNEEKPAGSYEINFNAYNLSSGIYFYTIKAGGFVQTKKLILLK